MENNFEQYEALLANAAEVAEACLDLEGGAFLLTWTGELIRDLVAASCFRSAGLTIHKLCEAAGVDGVWAFCDELNPQEKQAWLNLFAVALMDYVIAVTE